jgi:hypothetical protein
VHLGQELPPWLSATIVQARHFNNCPIYLVAEAAAHKRGAIPAHPNTTKIVLEDIGISDKQRAFHAISPLDREFRGGFWTYTTERFFVIETAIGALGLRNVAHLENDALLYTDIETLAPRLSKLYTSVAATFLNDDCCVPSFVYLLGAEAATKLSEAVLWVFDKLLSSPQYPTLRSQVNDMLLLAILRMNCENVIDHLPKVPPNYPGQLRSEMGHVPVDPSRYTKNFEDLNFVFDGAALGQYLGGIDPQNPPPHEPGYVNPGSVFDPGALNPHLIEDDRGRKLPVVESNGKPIPSPISIFAQRTCDNFCRDSGRERRAMSAMLLPNQVRATFG